ARLVEGRLRAEQARTVSVTASTSHEASAKSERDAGQGLRRLHAGDRPDLRDHDRSDRVVRIRFDLRDEIVVAEKRVQLDDLSDLHQGRVDFLLAAWFDADQDESDLRGGTCGSPQVRGR